MLSMVRSLLELPCVALATAAIAAAAVLSLWSES